MRRKISAHAPGGPRSRASLYDGLNNRQHDRDGDKLGPTKGCREYVKLCEEIVYVLDSVHVNPEEDKVTNFLLILVF